MIPKTQRAVQLVGPDRLILNEAKVVPMPGPYQVLCKVEVCGLCFSDLKLLKQFNSHLRKCEIVSGLDPQVLAEIPSYVPGDKPTVPGHETVVRVVAAGEKVRHARVGGRYLVQTDYRWLPTPGSCAAFGYNFEGALQEYVLMDERVITAPDGESMLLPVPEDISASAIALVEPWACVENAYAQVQRRHPKDGGKRLVVGNGGASPNAIPPEQFDDVIYFGSDPDVVEKLFPHVANNGLLIICQCGGRFGRPVTTPVGRVHYGNIRIAGTVGGDVTAALATIPATSEVRAGDSVNVIGAAGPMGMMHVIRALSLGLAGVRVFAGDITDERLAVLRRICEPLARTNGVELHPYNPQSAPLCQACTYIVIMAPVPALVTQAVQDAAPGAIINIFAGIPVDKTAMVDLDAYIAKQLYFIGTSGSVLDDMKAVLARVINGRLNTNLSVAAVSGLDGAIEGIRAVEKNLLPGKILVYPDCKGLGLTPLGEQVWNKAAEDALLARFRK
ncbi:MAG: alcohol dehydrogenase catalytic domain-containing protein [Verrucomicrobiae bacterium]|nr:alcohol dehydrogenase catalytic domain-containing protein [Verrucomicrobiae bacterium]